MKKNITRIFATASVVVALVFIIVLLVTAFGGITSEEYDNALVRGLFIAMGVVYLCLAGVTLALLFINDELVKEIVVRSDKEGGTRTTVGVIKKLTKDAIMKSEDTRIEGVKCNKCVVVVNEYGVRLKVTVSIKDRDLKEIEGLLRALLEDKFLGALDFRFHSIEIKVKKLQPKYKVDAEKIKAEVAERERIESESANESAEAEEVEAVSEVEAVAEAEGAETAEVTADEASDEVINDEAEAEASADETVEAAENAEESETDEVEETVADEADKVEEENE